MDATPPFGTPAPRRAPGDDTRPPPRGPVAPTDLYDDFLRRLHAACASASPSVRGHLFEHVNTTLAPHLNIEEAYFQLLLHKLAHVWHTGGQALRLCIDRNLLGQRVVRWARDYRIESIVYSKAHGGLSFMLQPREPGVEHASALCFPGTGPAHKRDIWAARDYPRGLRDDTHVQQIGLDGFMHHREAWTAQAHAVVAAGRDVLLVGHSLGGAYASLLFAHLQETWCESDLNRVFLLSLYAPGLSRQVARHMRPGRARVRCLRHRYDVTGWAGMSLPAGEWFVLADRIGTSLRDLQVPHAVPQLALRQLRHEAPQFRHMTCDIHDHSALLMVEMLRKAAGLVMRPFLPM